jgi:acylphosphatase
VRHLTVPASGATALALRQRLTPQTVDLLLSVDAVTDDAAQRYTSRDELDAALQAWVTNHPDGIVVMSAAVNDYQVSALERVCDGVSETIAAGAKTPSRADELIIRLRPAAKLIDQLVAWGHTGPLIGFKFEASDTVIGSAQALRARVGAALVVANSLDGSVQALVDDTVTSFANRDSLLDALGARLRDLAH